MRSISSGCSIRKESSLTRASTSGSALIATSLGCYLQIFQPSKDTLNVQFVNRVSVIKESCFFPSASEASLNSEPKTEDKKISSIQTVHLLLVKILRNIE